MNLETHDHKIWLKEARNITVSCKMRFDILNCLDVDHECDGQTDG